MPSSLANKPPRKSRTRTFSGCMTCRHRKVKCDVQKPTCGNCNRLGLSCRGYDTAIHWLPSWNPLAVAEGAGSPTLGGRMRTEIPSIHSQHDMLLEGMFEHGCRPEDIASQLDKVLAEVDSHAHDATTGPADHDGWQHTQGPFGVFSAVQSKASSPAPQHLPRQRPEEVDQRRLDCWDDTYTFGPSLLDDALLFLCESSTTIENQEMLPAVAQPASSPSWADTHKASISDVAQQDQNYPMQISSISDPTSSGQFELPLWQLSQTSSTPSPFSGSIYSPEFAQHDSPYLPHCAQYFLWHYSNHTIASLSGIPHNQDKSLWRQLHLPTALQAYAELGVLGDSSLPRVSLLYSLMSIACFQLKALHKNNSSSSTPRPTSSSSLKPQHWSASDYEAQAIKFKEIAQKGLNKFLKSTEWSAARAGGQSGHKNKYKEVLVAAISLVCIRIISGDTDDSRHYVRQCEDIIQKLGHDGNHKQSRKMKALRQTLLYIQVMESASSSHSISYQPAGVIALTSTEQEANDSIPTVAASASTSANDALIADPISSSATKCLFQDDVDTQAGAEGDQEVDGDDCAMYGVPASLLYLLSRTTTLIEDMEQHSNAQPQSTQTFLDLAKRTSLLENDICTWPARHQQEYDRKRRSNGHDRQTATEQLGLKTNSIMNDDSANHQAPVPLHHGSIHHEDGSSDKIALQMQGCLSRALHGAILIYFFRSTRKTHPAILQHYVSNVISELETHASLKMAFAPSRLNTIVWPSFIASCEANDDGLRTRGIACLRQAAWAGFGNWRLAQPVAYEVWRRRDGGEFGVSWQEVVREMPVKMVLT